MTHQELGEAIKYLRNWAAPGPDRIHNFFLKYITAGHPQMRTSIEKIINNKEKMDQELVRARTILLPKTTSPSESEYRPIAILNTIFKTITKITNSKLKSYITENEEISANQFAFLQETLGCKEALLVDEIISKETKDLKVIWLDIKKAFDSIQHPYLFRRLESLKIP